MNGKVSVDLDKLYKERMKENNANNGKKPMSIDELRAMEQEDTLLDYFSNKGKLSMVDYLMYQDMMDRRRSNNNNVDIQKLIEEAVKPYKEEVERMRKKEEEEKRNAQIEAIQEQLMELREAISGNKKEDDPLLKRFDELQKKIDSLNEEKTKKEQEDFQNSIKSSIERLNDEIRSIRNDPNAKKSDLERLEELEEIKKRYQKVLGIPSENDNASLADIASTGVDFFTNKVPGIMKTVNTIRDGFKNNNDDDIPDDVPVDLPANVPARGDKAINKSAIPDDIKEFLDRGTTKNNGFVDYSGLAWRDSITNEPLTRKDIETMAITDPDTVRELMRQCEEDYKKQVEKEKQKDSNIDNKIPEEHEDENKKEDEDKDKKEIEDMKPDKKDLEIAEKAVADEKTDYMKQAMDYINSGKETEKDGKKIWVGANGETFIGENGEMSKDDLIAEANYDPELFMENVKSSLGAGNGNKKGTD